MKTIWGRIGVEFSLSSKQYAALRKAMIANDVKRVSQILANSSMHVAGDSYLPADVMDNPNSTEFDLIPDRLEISKRVSDML